MNIRGSLLLTFFLSFLALTAGCASTGNRAAEASAHDSTLADEARDILARVRETGRSEPFYDAVGDVDQSSVLTRAVQRIGEYSDGAGERATKARAIRALALVIELDAQVPAWQDSLRREITEQSPKAVKLLDNNVRDAVWDKLPAEVQKSLGAYRLSSGFRRALYTAAQSARFETSK
jgi:hypothetical protein